MLSIIVPIYNVEAYLPRCIDSILAQTYTDFELILVDDGSPDNCPSICDEYAEKDSRIIVIHKENGGLSSARNAGLDIAQGDYIGFVDSDDFIHPQMYERLMESLTDNNADISICNFERVNEAGNPISDLYPLLTSSVSSGINILRDFKKSGYLNIQYIVVVNKVFSRDLWNNIRFPIGRIHEDEFVAHHLLGASKCVSSINEQFYYYRQTSGSIMNKPYNLRRLDWFIALEDRVEYLLKLDLHEEAVAVLSRYFEMLRVKYFLIRDHDNINYHLYEIRKKACKFWHIYSRNSKDIWTIKVATFAFLASPSLYRIIWKR